MKNFFHILITALFVLPLQLLAQNDNRILLHSGALTPSANLEDFIKEQSPSANEIFNGYYYRFIQFTSIPNMHQKEVISSVGIKLLDYIPHNTYMAALPVSLNKTQLSTLNIRSVITQQAFQKINSKLIGIPEYAVKEKGMVDVVVQYQQNISQEIAQAEASKYGVKLSVSRINHTINLRISDKDINKLASQPWIFYMDAVSPASTPDDTKGRSLHRSNFINSNYNTGMHYDGAGVVIGLADDGEIGPHIDFTGRFTDHVGTGPGGTHGDMTSGIAIGAGNLDPVIRGMATGAHLQVYDINGYPHIIDAVNNYTTLGTVITSTSYSQGCNEYTTDTEFGDQTIHDNPQLEFVFSAGNNGGGDCGYGAGAGWGNITGGYKQGKNVIACANLSPLEVLDNTSSKGPASDGRIKPDISSNGLDQMSTDQNNTYQVGGGTSAACPGIAGICAQLYQAYKEMSGGNNPESPLIKACLLNSAEDIGNPGPDYTYGWGRVNARRALATLQEGRYLLDSISQGDTNTHTIVVPANIRQLRVMLYWLDPAGSPVSTQYLVNDLDMQVTDPTAFTPYDPWVLDPTPNAVNLSDTAVRGIDHLNNMEQVTIDAPGSGNFTITITGNAVPQGPQRYYIVYEFRTDEITVTYPNGGEGFVPNEQEVIRWDAPKGVSSFVLQYTTNAGLTWNNIGTANSAALQYTWTVPDSITGEACIRVSNGVSTDVSDTLFTIIRTPQNISVDWACPDSIRLIWDPVPGATGYEIYQLGAMYMDPVATSTTNSVILTGTNPIDEYWFSVSAIASNGSKGRRALAIHKAAGVFNCPLAIDAQISTALSPAAGSLQSCQDNSALSVSIVIENRGQNPIIDVPVGFSLDGGPAINETYIGTIAPSTSVTYTFTATVDLSGIGNHILQIWSSYVGDLNSFNDTLAQSINVLFGTLAPLPFTETFDIFALCSTNNDCEATVCAVPNGWINEESGVADDIDFRTNEGATPSVGTGPDVDHTTGTGTGRYMYLEASNGCFGKTALLTSPCVDLTASTAPQVVFYYHMYGANMGELHLDVYSEDTWTMDVMTPIVGDQGNSWHQVIVPLTSFAGNIVNLRFRGITGNDFASDLAIDDINVLESNAPPIASFFSSDNIGCVGTLITFTDQSLNFPSSWSWSFTPNTVSFVNGTTATSQNPQVQFNTAGNYDVTLTATNSFGSNAASQTSFVTILATAPMPVVENFQGASFPPQNWHVESAGGAFTWDKATGIVGSDGNTTDAAFLNNFDYNNVGAEDGLATYEFDLTGSVAPILTFDVAYARYDGTFFESLRVDVSTDCGTTYTPSGYFKSSTDLATVPDQNSAYSPQNATDWRNDTVSLSAWSGNIVVKFVNVNGYGNYLYIDNVNIDNAVGLHEHEFTGNIIVYPNPSNGLFNIVMNGLQKDLLDIQLYNMEGKLLQQNAVHVFGSYKSTLDMSTYSKGIYFLEIKGTNGVKRFKLTVI